MGYNPGVQDVSGALIGRGLENLADRLAAVQDEKKQRARLFKSLQEYAEVTGLATKDETAVMDLESLQGRVEGTIAKRHEEDRTARQAILAEQLQQYVAERNRTGALENFGRDLQGTMEAPLVLSPEARAAHVPQLSRANLMAALSRNPGALAHPQMDNVLGVLARITGGAEHVPGTVRQVEGLPGYVYGVQSPEGSGSFIPTGPKTAEPPEKAPPGYQIVKHPKGGWQYLKMPEGGLDPAEFDANKDGVLSDIEYRDFLMTEKLGAYPGMKVKPKASAAPGAGLFQSFEEWKKKQSGGK